MFIIIFLFLVGAFLTAMIIRSSANKIRRLILIASAVIILFSIGTCVATTPDNPRVHVRGYTRSDGTRVSGYTRRYPNQRDENSPYYNQVVLTCILTIIFGNYALYLHAKKEDEDTKARLENYNELQATDGVYKLKTQNTSRYGFYDTLSSLGHKISLSVVDFSVDSEALNVQSFQRLRTILERYSTGNSSFMIVHAKRDRKCLRYFSHGFNYEARTLDSFSTDIKRNYGHLSITEFLQKARNYIYNSNTLILNKECYKLLLLHLNNQDTEMLIEKTFIWGNDHVFDCNMNEECIRGVGINPLKLCNTFGHSYSLPQRFGEEHEEICRFFLSFQLESIALIGVEPVLEESLNFFKKPYYFEMQKILRTHYKSLGKYNGLMLYGLK